MKYLICLFLFFGGWQLSAQTNIQAGEPAPEIVVTHWLKNEPRNLSFRNKFIVLDFWATWCAPCLDAVPQLNELRKAFPREDLYFISLTKESPATASSVFDRVDFQVSVGCDVTGKTEVNFGNGKTGLSRFPTTVLIDNRNIVRWVGSPYNLTTEKMSRFLTDSMIVEPTRTKFIPLASDPDRATEFQPRKMTWEEFDAEGQNEDNPAFLHVYPLDGPPEFSMATASYSLGSTAYFNGVTLEGYFSHMYPDIKIVVPYELKEPLYQIAFKNDNPDRESHYQVIHNLIAQTGYEAVITTEPAKQYTITISNGRKLVPTESEARWPSCKEDDFGALLCTKQKLTELASYLNTETDNHWIYEGANRKRYDFELFMSSPETLLSSLKEYGLGVKAKTIEIEVVTVTPRR